MRKLLVTSVLTLGIAAQATAASNWDGLYYCNVAAAGISGTVQTYVAINSKSATSAIFTIPAMNPTNTFFGTGIGTIATDTKAANYSGLANNTFKGNTNMGNPFNFNLDKNNVIRGTITISYAPMPSIKVLSTVACAKSW